MDTLDTTVLELLASRICHDIISPVGAVHNGVEFLEEAGPDDSDDAIALIAHSAQNAAIRLQVFRIVYGTGGADPSIKPWDVHKTFDELVAADKRVTQDWDGRSLNLDEVPAGFCKLLLGCLMLGQENLPRGGVVRVEQDSPRAFIIRAEGADAGSRANVAESLAGTLPVDQLDPRLIHPYVLGHMARKYGYDITVGAQGDGQVAYHLQAS